MAGGGGASAATAGAAANGVSASRAVVAGDVLYLVAGPMAPVPLPAAAWLSLGGLAALVFVGRPRRGARPHG